MAFVSSFEVETVGMTVPYPSLVGWRATSVWNRERHQFGLQRQWRRIMLPWRDFDHEEASPVHSRRRRRGL
jgi:hypothetical protein